MLKRRHGESLMSIVDLIKNNFANAIVRRCSERNCKLGLNGLSNYIILKGERVCQNRKICDCIIFAEGINETRRSICPVEEFLLNGLLNLDYDQMLQNVDLLTDIMREEGHCKVTSTNGTHLEFEVGDRPVVSSPGKVSTPGVLNWFPGALLGVAPIETSINGTIAVDGSLFPFGVVEADPVLLEVEEGVIKEIHGGRLAQRFSEWMDSLNDPVAYHFCHFSVGFNPRAEMKGATMEDERCLGAVTIGFGRQPAKFKGTIIGGDHHIDVVLKPLVITSGGKTVLENGLFAKGLGLINM